MLGFLAKWATLREQEHARTASLLVLLNKVMRCFDPCSLMWTTATFAICLGCEVEAVQTR
jgi:hypothetical protein